MQGIRKKNGLGGGLFIRQVEGGGKASSTLGGLRVEGAQ